MRLRVPERTTCAVGAVVFIAFAAAGCGGGGGGGGSSSFSGGDGGGLNFRPIWEQPTLAPRRLSAATGDGTESRPSAAFGPTLPASVQTVRIEFNSSSGQRCCLAVDPTLLPTNPETGRRVLVLDELPSGSASLTLAGFATDFAPVAVAVEACPTKPIGVGAACDPTRPATPSFESDPRTVTIVGGTQTNAGDIPVFAVPFLIDLTPQAADSVANPVAIRFAVVDAATGIDEGSVATSISQTGRPAVSLNLAMTACDDAGSRPCSPAGQLGVRGFQTVATAGNLNLGAAQVRVQATNQGSPPRSVDFDYPVTVRNAPPAESTPTPTGTPVPSGGLIIVRPGQDIAAIAKAAPSGATLLVAPGVYASVTLAPGDLQGPLALVADPTGAGTDSPAAPVVISVRGTSPAVDLTGQADLTLDGFSLRGGVGAGVRVSESDRITVRNCLIAENRGDGVLFDASSDGLVFNNVIFDNEGSGVRMRGSVGLRIINNTVYGNADDGVVVGDADAPSSNPVIRSNIFNDNGGAGLSIDASTLVVDFDYNLNTDGYAGDAAPAPHDVAGDLANPLFVAPGREDFHLAVGLVGSQSPAVDTGDPATDATLLATLTTRTTQPDGTLDTPPVDLGYHYAAPAPTPTPRPRPTRTPTPTAAE